MSDLQTLYAARTYKEKAPQPATPSPDPDPPVNIVTFPDIKGHWGRPYIEKLATKSIIFGLDANTFAPDMKLDRAQAVALIVRALELPLEKSNVFSDVPSDAWYAGSVGAAVKAGIVSGVGADKFAPAAPVDRNQAATMIYNALQVKQKAPTAATTVTFKDEVDIASWAKDKVKALASAKIMVGDDQGYFRPTQTTTRAQAAVMIHNMMDYAGLLK
jgi:2',3'-cyclic-nucleotide 2'-phosphodiesterase/3'-nucleotidase/2',3'-cyclic-nucleotide 2'-phosphodiesterase/3'-nucleotidase/5'-nucleotidase